MEYQTVHSNRRNPSPTDNRGPTSQHLEVFTSARSTSTKDDNVLEVPYKLRQRIILFLDLENGKKRNMYSATAPTTLLLDNEETLEEGENKSTSSNGASSLQVNENFLINIAPGEGQKATISLICEGGNRKLQISSEQKDSENTLTLNKSEDSMKRLTLKSTDDVNEDAVAPFSYLIINSSQNETEDIATNLQESEVVQAVNVYPRFDECRETKRKNLYQKNGVPENFQADTVKKSTIPFSGTSNKSTDSFEASELRDAIGFTHSKTFSLSSSSSTTTEEWFLATCEDPILEPPTLDSSLSDTSIPENFNLGAISFNANFIPAFDHELKTNADKESQTVCSLLQNEQLEREFSNHARQEDIRFQLQTRKTDPAFQNRTVGKVEISKFLIMRILRLVSEVNDALNVREKCFTDCGDAFEVDIEKNLEECVNMINSCLFQRGKQTHEVSKKNKRVQTQISYSELEPIKLSSHQLPFPKISTKSIEIKATTEMDTKNESGYSKIPTTSSALSNPFRRNSKIRKPENVNISASSSDEGIAMKTDNRSSHSSDEIPSTTAGIFQSTKTQIATREIPSTAAGLAQSTKKQKTSGEMQSLTTGIVQSFQLQNFYGKIRPTVAGIAQSTKSQISSGEIPSTAAGLAQSTKKQKNSGESLTAGIVQSFKPQNTYGKIRPTVAGIAQPTKTQIVSGEIPSTAAGLAQSTKTQKTSGEIHSLTAGIVQSFKQQNTYGKIRPTVAGIAQSTKTQKSSGEIPSTAAGVVQSNKTSESLVETGLLDHLKLDTKREALRSASSSKASISDVAAKTNKVRLVVKADVHISPHVAKRNFETCDDLYTNVEDRFNRRNLKPIHPSRQKSPSVTTPPKRDDISTYDLPYSEQSFLFSRPPVITTSKYEAFKAFRNTINPIGGRVKVLGDSDFKPNIVRIRRSSSVSHFQIYPESTTNRNLPDGSRDKGIEDQDQLKIFNETIPETGLKKRFLTTIFNKIASPFKKSKKEEEHIYEEICDPTRLEQFYLDKMKERQETRKFIKDKDESVDKWVEENTNRNSARVDYFITRIRRLKKKNKTDPTYENVESK